MPLWTANTTATKPTWLNRVEKRNVIATDIGWVRRLTKPTGRIQDELLVDITGLASAVGAPKPVDVYFSRETANVGDTVIVSVVYNGPLRFLANSGEVKLVVTNSLEGAANATVDAVSLAAANTDQLSTANNTLNFTFTVGEAGTFTVLAQTMANSGANAVSLRSLTSTNAAANLQIASAAVSALTALTVAE